MSKKEIEMLPCPFCGFKEIGPREDEDGNQRAYCYTCGSQGAPHRNPVLAAESWNSRAKLKD